MPSISISFGGAVQPILTAGSITFNVLWISLYVVVSWQHKQQQGVFDVGGEAVRINDQGRLDVNHRKLLQQEVDVHQKVELRARASNTNTVEPLRTTDDNPFRMPLEYVELAKNHTPPGVASHGHCIGNNFRKETAWYYTSCHVRLLCYDTVERDYVVMDSPTESELKSAVSKELRSESSQFTIDMYTTAADLDAEWSIGVINPQWAPQDWPRLKRQLRRVPPQDYFALPGDVVLVPFHSMAGFNPGHLIWDDFMALWLLLDVFDLWKKDKHMLYIREMMNPGIWATCDDNEDLHQRCRKLMPRFFPLMGSSQTLLFEPPTREQIFGNSDENDDANSNSRSRLICAKEGVVGLGMMSDHGRKQHGWWDADYEWNHNVGRGPQLWRFRNFMMENLLGEARAKAASRQRDKPILIFSEKSSARSFDLAPFSKFVVQTFGDEVEVHRVVFHELAVEEQVSLTARASMLFSTAGGGTVTGMFLPRGASLVLWYESDSPDGGSIVPEPNDIPKTACRLDFDLWNNAGYIRSHWLPYLGAQNFDPVFPPGPTLETLIRHELDIMAKQGY